MNIPLIKTSTSIGRQIDFATLLRKVVWVSVVTISILYSLAGSQDNLLDLHTDFQRWIYVYLNFLSFVLGVLASAIIFFRKPKSWMAFATSLMLITFTATDGGVRFWYLVFTGVPFTVGVPNDTIPYTISLFFNVLYMGLLTSSLAFVLLAFPEETLASRRVRWFFNVLISSQVLVILLLGALFLCVVFNIGGFDVMFAYNVYSLLDVVKSILLIALAVWQIARLGKITDSVQRQQIKWIVSSLIGMTVFYAVGTMSAVLFDTGWVPIWIFLLGLIFTYGFIITLFIAIVRYRFWDMKVIVNKALVYSAVTAILGVIGFAGADLLEFLAKRYMESDTTIAGAFILLPLAALFTPIRDGIQSLVDNYLKPEEVDFSSAIVEFAPDAQLMLSSQDMLGILVRQTVEQLNISGAAIYLRREDGQLVQSESAPTESGLPPLRLDDKTHAKLEHGNVVVPPDTSPFSLYLPLIIQRASKPQFLGVLVFGRRNSGEGYPTPVLKSLRKLGCDAGKAIYIAQLREHLGQNILERLASIERSLSALNKPMDA